MSQIARRLQSAPSPFALARRFPAACAAIAALLCAAAAPYMIPSNPDSAVYRSGWLGLLLLAACAYPVCQAYARADRRTLRASYIVGLLFALALSLGSELFVYDGLLRGAGSLIRRIAVPLLAAPMLGGLCARVLIARDPFESQRALRLGAWAYALIIFLCWLPLLAAYFPGMLNYDFAGEFAQHTSGSYSSIHPLLHSAIMNGVIALGESLHSRTFGVLLVSLLQMTLFALALGYSCAFAQRRGAPAWASLLMTALYALHPVFSVMSLSMTKDTLFAAAILTLSLLAFELIESPEAFLRHKGRCALFIVCCVGGALLRNNGVFALALVLPGVVAATKGFRRRTALLSAAGAGASLLTLALLNLALSPSSMPSFQLYSLPAQQLVRAYNSGSMSEEDKAEIASWYTSEEGLIVHPHLADPAKGYLDSARLEEEGDAFLALWKKHAKTYAHEYLEALLMLNVGSWYPDDLSHSTIYPDVSWNDKGYLQTQEYDMSEQDIETTCYLPTVRALFEKICRRNAYQEYPVISVLFAVATPLWLLLVAWAALASRGQLRYLPSLLGTLGLWLGYLLGPCTLPRYALPLFCLAPVMLCTALTMKRKEDAHETP